MAEIGQILNGRYRLVELLGEGGMATIYRATDAELGRDVAVKVMRGEYGRDAAFIARFRQEAQSAARLTHPNVVGVYDYGTDGDAPFIVMELVAGGDLAAVLRERGALPVGAAARIAGQIADALEAAHARGIVHRDVKPSNVLLTPDGRVKVVDFGIARALSEAQLTLPGTTLGSVHYFSPEQARGEVVTPRSDVYSLGLVLWEMLTGRRTWSGDSAAAVAVARLSSDPPPPSTIRPEVPRSMDAITGKALARDPALRFASAAEFAAALERFLRDPNAPPFPGAFADLAGGTAASAAAVTALTLDGPPSGRGGGATPPVEPLSMALLASPPPTPRSVIVGPGYGGWGNDSEYGGGGPMPPYADEEGVAQPPRSGPSGWVLGLLGLLVLLAGAALLFALLSGGRGGPGPSPTPARLAVPSFVDIPFSDAQRLAQQRGLAVTIADTVQRDDKADGTVIAQDPASGATVEPGTIVKLTVSTSTPSVTIPELRMLSESDARAALVDAGLTVGRRDESYDTAVPAGSVIRSEPRSGVEVQRGTPVDYWVSVGTAPSPSPTPSPSPSPSPPPSPTPVPSASPPPTSPPSPTAPPSPPASPSPSPSPSPPATPTASPTEPPTASPTAPPTASPTQPPTKPPTASPTAPPTEPPTVPPTAPPTAPATASSTEPPTAPPSPSPSP